MVGRRRLEASFPCPHSTATSTGRTARSPSGRRSLQWLRTVSRPRARCVGSNGSAAATDSAAWSRNTNSRQAEASALHAGLSFPLACYTRARIPECAGRRKRSRSDRPRPRRSVPAASRSTGSAASNLTSSPRRLDFRHLRALGAPACVGRKGRLPSRVPSSRSGAAIVPQLVAQASSSRSPEGVRVSV